MKAKIRGTEIYFDIAGMQLVPQGKKLIERPVLFMLHGGPGGDHLRFKQHSLELQEVAQLVFIDHRGCGRSKKTYPKDYTLENNVEDIEALRKHLGLEKIAILGASYGGIVAQAYAIRYPKRVSKLILAVTSPSHHFIAEAKQILHDRGTPKQIEIAKKLWSGTFKSQKELAQYFKLMEPLYSVVAKTKKKHIYSNIKTTWSYDALNKGFSGFLRHFNLIPRLKKITAPTLILAGAQDWICPPTQSKLLAMHIPNAKLKIFKDAAHAIATDAHAQYIKSIQSFLK